MRKILITGSNGLLGQNLVNKLLEKDTYIIYGVSRGENRNKKGEKFTDKNTKSIRPGYGLHPKHLNDILNKTAKYNIEKGEALSWKMIN